MHYSSPTVEEFYREKLMERSPEERFMMGIRMFEAARSMVFASFPPNLSPSERSFNLFLRFYGHELDEETKNQVRELIKQRAEGRGRRAEDGGRRVEGGGQRVEGGGRKAEDGRQKTPQLNTQRVPGSTPVRSAGPTGQAGQGGRTGGLQLI